MSVGKWKVYSMKDISSNKFNSKRTCLTSKWTPSKTSFLVFCFWFWDVPNYAIRGNSITFSIFLAITWPYYHIGKGDKVYCCRKGLLFRLGNIHFGGYRSWPSVFGSYHFLWVLPSLFLLFEAQGDEKSKSWPVGIKPTCMMRHTLANLSPVMDILIGGGHNILPSSEGAVRMTVFPIALATNFPLSGKWFVGSLMQTRAGVVGRLFGDWWGSIDKMLPFSTANSHNRH